MTGVDSITIDVAFVVLDAYAAHLRVSGCVRFGQARRLVRAFAGRHPGCPNQEIRPFEFFLIRALIGQFRRAIHIRLFLIKQRACRSLSLCLD
jgi:hypothetical protein